MNTAQQKIWSADKINLQASKQTSWEKIEAIIKAMPLFKSYSWILGKSYM